ncbi:MAG: TrkH family potassium uptake protein [Treponemataceae bacterium]|nr:TrkH family potassium uptake protein [Treponemataceae bacterium]
MVLLVLRLISFLLAIISLTFILPCACGLYYGETEAVLSFVWPFVFCFLFAAIMFFAGKKNNAKKLSLRSGYVLVAVAWVMACVLGAVPLLLSGVVSSFTDAFFESVSGFSTTGATILNDVEALPNCINLWRMQMHWLGGMGIVVLTVALLPLLGVGGFQLIKAETTGPDKGKITPKIATTAKILWFIYVGMTLVETLLLMLCGMSFWEALSYSFSTLGTGGFATKNASIAAYNSSAIEWICCIFMALSGINFSLYFQAFKGNFKEIVKNTELKFYIALLAVSIFIVTFSLLPQYHDFCLAARLASFQVVSIVTTTGFGTADFTFWVPAAQFVIFMLMFVGGCSGSTGGGFKVIRWVVLGKQASNEMRHILHPHGVFTIRINNDPGRKDLVFSVAAFGLLYAFLVLISTFIGTLFGLDLFSAFTGGLAMVGNIGPGFGMIGPSQNYGFLAPFVKWWYSFAMLAGRLELYTLLLFFSPSFWKK